MLERGDGEKGGLALPRKPILSAPNDLGAIFHEDAERFYGEVAVRARRYEIAKRSGIQSAIGAAGSSGDVGVVQLCTVQIELHVARPAIVL
jgi:hypothetical protein